MAPDPLERELEGFFRKRVRLLGGITWKLVPTEVGIPDRLVMFPGGRTYLVELKRTGGKLSPVQKVQHAKLKELGHPVYVLYGREDIVRWLGLLVGATGPQSKPRRPAKQSVG